MLKIHISTVLSSHCFPNPCKNEGLCTEVKNKDGYMCICNEGFVGKNCESKNNWF